MSLDHIEITNANLTLNYGCMESIWRNFTQLQSDISTSVDSWLNSLADTDINCAKKSLARAVFISDENENFINISQQTKDKINSK